jgi:hypothetical protein
MAVVAAEIFINCLKQRRRWRLSRSVYTSTCHSLVLSRLMETFTLTLTFYSTILFFHSRMHQKGLDSISTFLIFLLNFYLHYKCLHLYYSYISKQICFLTIHCILWVKNTIRNHFVVGSNAQTIYFS